MTKALTVMLLWYLLAVASPLVQLGGGSSNLVRRRAEEGLAEAVEMSSDDPLVQRVAAEVAQITGADLDSLLNPAKLINVERDLVLLRSQRDALTERDEDLEAQIAKKEAIAYVEKRAVMKDWLKWLFRGQAYVTMALSLVAVYDAFPGIHLDISIQVLGFWSWWLFTVPSLRSIKPLGPKEKRSLDAAFFATLVASLVAPVATKDPALIWWIDAAVVGASFGYGYLAPEGDDVIDDDDTFDAQASTGAGAFGQSLWRAARFAVKALDFGSGIERGARQADKSQIEKVLDSAIQQRAVTSITNASMTPPSSETTTTTTTTTTVTSPLSKTEDPTDAN